MKCVVELGEGEKLLVVRNNQFYQLGGQVGDVVGSHVLTEMRQTYWCSINQDWEDVGSAAAMVDELPDDPVVQFKWSTVKRENVWPVKTTSDERLCVWCKTTGRIFFGHKHHFHLHVGDKVAHLPMETP